MANLSEPEDGTDAEGGRTYKTVAHGGAEKQLGGAQASWWGALKDPVVLS